MLPRGSSSIHPRSILSRRVTRYVIDAGVFIYVARGTRKIETSSIHHVVKLLLSLAPYREDKEPSPAIHYVENSLADGPESEPLPKPTHTSCIEQVQAAKQLSYSLAEYRLRCIIAIVSASTTQTLWTRHVCKCYFSLKYSILFFLFILCFWPYLLNRPYSHWPWSWPYLAMGYF